MIAEIGIVAEHKPCDCNQGKGLSTDCTNHANYWLLFPKDVLYNFILTDGNTEVPLVFLVINICFGNEWAHFILKGIGNHFGNFFDLQDSLHDVTEWNQIHPLEGRVIHILLACSEPVDLAERHLRVALHSRGEVGISLFRVLISFRICGALCENFATESQMGGHTFKLCVGITETLISGRVVSKTLCLINFGSFSTSVDHHVKA